MIRDELLRHTLPDLQEPTHGFSHTPVDLTSQYTPPVVSGGGPTSYGYDLDRRLESVTRPDDLDLSLEYESGSGRLERIVQARGESEFGYHTASGYLASVTSPDTVTVSYGYDGPLMTNESWSGKVAGLVRRSYSKDFLPESLTVSTGSEAHSVVHDYDDDGLLTEVGSPEGTLTIARRAADGLVSGTTLGNVTTAQDYTSHGELKLFAARYNSDTLYRASYDRDPLGRITAWHEREGATLRSREFVYDTTGRLWQVWDRQASPDTLIARAMMARPRLLLLDEPSLGIAPILMREIFQTIKAINQRGMTVLLVEQNAHMALAIARRGYVLETGSVRLEDSAANLLKNDEVRKAYLGG